MPTAIHGCRSHGTAYDSLPPRWPSSSGASRIREWAVPPRSADPQPASCTIKHTIVRACR
eukprot:scaffold154011_cov31-Tisochrysis_lutea.AAC.1